jgi:hypothetical protein
MGNIKRDRFVKVATKRVQNIIDNLESLSKCSNRSNYEYSKKDVDKMVSAIKQKLKIVEDKFRDKESGESDKFSF